MRCHFAALKADVKEESVALAVAGGRRDCVRGLATGQVDRAAVAANALANLTAVGVRPGAVDAR